MRDTILFKERALLAKAWGLACYPSKDPAYVTEAHIVMSHADNSSCDDGHSCSINAEGLLMFELAHEVAAMNGTFEDLLAAWATDGRRLANRNTIVSIELDAISEAM